MPEAWLRDRRIFYEVQGTGADCLLFVHGFRNSAESWSLVRERLDTDRFCAWYLDLPGCGRSGTPPTWKDCTVAQYADDVYQFCSAQGLREVVLIGHSLGGGVAMLVALDHPEVLRALVLVAPTPADGLGYLRDDQLDSLINPSDDELVAVTRAAFHRPPSEAVFDRLLATVRTASPSHVEGAIRSQRAFNVADRLAEISTPTLVVAGDRDRHVPIRHTLRTAATIRHCAVQICHNVGHAPFFEVPDDFAALVQGFVGNDLSSEPGKRRRE